MQERKRGAGRKAGVFRFALLSPRGETPSDLARLLLIFLGK